MYNMAVNIPGWCNYLHITAVHEMDGACSVEHKLQNRSSADQDIWSGWWSDGDRGGGCCACGLVGAVNKEKAPSPNPVNIYVINVKIGDTTIVMCNVSGGMGVFYVREDITFTMIVSWPQNIKKSPRWWNGMEDIRDHKCILATISSAGCCMQCGMQAAACRARTAVLQYVDNNGCKSLRAELLQTLAAR